MTKYMVVTLFSYKKVADGFRSAYGALQWADAHDWGQYEEEGGLMVVPYEAEED